MVTLLSRRAIEEVKYHCRVSTGVIDDIKQATDMGILYFIKKLFWRMNSCKYVMGYVLFYAGLISFSGGAPCPSIRSAFYGQSIQMPASLWVSARGSRNTKPVTMMSKPVIQFIQGMDEQTIPDVKLTKSRDGTNGVATFIFDQPSVFDSTGELGEITGLYMIDEEGVLQSVDVNAKFINGKPSRIEARYVMKSPREWDRFMRFMERYSNENGLQFVKK